MQVTTAEKAAPALLGLLHALKEGLQSYEASRQELVEVDAAKGQAPDHVPNGQACQDQHEKCPFWASIVSQSKHLDICYPASVPTAYPLSQLVAEVSIVGLMK